MKNIDHLESYLPKSQKKEKVDVHKCFQEASSMISPIWDSRDAVAVNPFFGLRHKEFLKAVSLVRGSVGHDLLPNKNFFKEKVESGEITRDDLEAIFRSHGKGANFEDTLNHLREIDSDDNLLSLRCISDIYGEHWSSDFTGQVSAEISKWMAAYFDEGQALWKISSEGKRLYSWWRELSVHDNFFAKTSRSSLSLIKQLPEKPEDALDFLTMKVLEFVNLNQEELSRYYYRLFMSCSGWASWIKRFEFEAENFGDAAKLDKYGGCIDFLVIRMAYDLSVLEHPLNLDSLKMNESTARPSQDEENRHIFLQALERSYRRRVISQIISSQKKRPQKIENPKAQMVFCIDVRSEVLRRHLELQNNSIQTLGFAGFFGAPISVKGLGHEQGDQQCPILIKPKEEVSQISYKSNSLLSDKKKAKASFKYLTRDVASSAHSGFSFVETLGFTYMKKILDSSFGRSKTNLDISSLGLSKEEAQKIDYDLGNLSFDFKVTTAIGSLKNMGLTRNLAEFVFLFGHGSESANNPYASTLDCGACAGHNGHPNSRILANILNDRDVRSALKEKDITIPDSTIFLSGWHNTTTDEIVVDRVVDLSEDQEATLNDIVEDIVKACKKSQLERLQKLGEYSELADKDCEKEIFKRSKDWSQIRPEWGLATNACFIIARRELTRAQDLEGRAFLHDYNCREDHDLSILELIMTAPMIVTNWINMQYYASTVAPHKFGAGDKTLSNVVGTFGCVEGNSGDLLGGLSKQSVWFKDKYYHEPIRLQVFIECEKKAIKSIIDKHEVVKSLCDSQWLHIISICPDTHRTYLYQSGEWSEVKELQ